ANRLVTHFDWNPAPQRDHIGKLTLGSELGHFGGSLRPFGAGAAKSPRRVSLAAGKLEVMGIGLVRLQEHPKPSGAIDHGNRYAVAVLFALVEGADGDCQSHAHPDVPLGDDLRLRRQRAGGDKAGSQSTSNRHERTSLFIVGSGPIAPARRFGVLRSADYLTCEAVEHRGGRLMSSAVEAFAFERCHLTCAMSSLYGHPTSRGGDGPLRGDPTRHRKHVI